MPGDCSVFFVEKITENDEEEENSWDNLIKSVVRQYHWQPRIISSLYADNQDYMGLIYWYEDALDIAREMKIKSKKK